MLETLSTFHLQLFGRRPSQFTLNETHRELYAAFSDGARGFLAVSPEAHNMDHFVAVWTIALYQTAFPTKGVAQLVIAPHHRDWCTKAATEATRYMFRERKRLGHTRESLEPLIEAGGRIQWATRPLQMTLPERWACYGLSHPPEWAKPYLI